MHMSRRSALMSGAAIASLAALGGCDQKPAGPSADETFAALGTKWIGDYARLRPAGATQLGDHRFDGELDDVSAAGRAAKSALVKETSGCAGRHRPHHAVARQPGRRRDAQRTARERNILAGHAAGLGLGSAHLCEPDGRRALFAGGARVRAAAGAADQRGIADGEVPAAARRDAQAARSGARAVYPCADLCWTEWRGDLDHRRPDPRPGVWPAARQTFRACRPPPRRRKLR